MKVVHAIRYFSGTTLLLCRKNRPAYKEYKTIYKMISRKFDKDFDDLAKEITCKKCRAELARREGPLNAKE